jgi:CRP/FNR family transcriptional regulator, cyclic AMP receptor protein
MEDPMPLTPERRAELLGATPLFAGVDADGLARIALRTVEIDAAPGQVIARQGEIGTGFFVVVEGAANVIRDGDVIAHLGPGEFFGELSVLDGRPRVAAVLADGPTICLALASWDFEAVVREEPAVALAVMRGLATRIRELTEGSRH